MKSDDDRFTVIGDRFGFEFINDLPVPHMHAVKSADGDHCIPESRQIFNVSVYYHKSCKYNLPSFNGAQI
jgi:hypothetical protein